VVKVRLWPKAQQDGQADEGHQSIFDEHRPAEARLELLVGQPGGDVKSQEQDQPPVRPEMRQ